MRILKFLAGVGLIVALVACGGGKFTRDGGECTSCDSQRSGGCGEYASSNCRSYTGNCGSDYIHKLGVISRIRGSHHHVCQK